MQMPSANHREAAPDIARTRGLFSDLRTFVLRKPPLTTLVPSSKESERQDYGQRILQRVGIDVTDYSVLNIHGIGIRAPGTHVFQEVLQWTGESPCWPNHLATVEHLDEKHENMRIFLLGRWTRWLRRRWPGPGFGALFHLKALKRQQVPDPWNFDNARYLLYECSGGYPIGYLAIYVRSSIPDRQEAEETQLFFAVGFNFFGKKGGPRPGIVQKVWERLHNRVTANVLNRFKQVCEAEFTRLAKGTGGAETIGDDLPDRLGPASRTAE
jgi:hypothetical protein